MTAAGTGAVFFLGTRAHYQVLQQPETRSFDIENGNASTETIYQNPSVQELWPADQRADERNWNCYDNNEVNLSDEKDKSEMGNGMKRRCKRRQSEATLFERDSDMRPALLNSLGNSLTPKLKPSRRKLPLLAFLSSLARRKRRMDHEQIQYLQHLESALNTCTYRESCRCLDCQIQYLQHLESTLNTCTYRESYRCLDCQSRYFDCDESEEYSSDESESPTRYITPTPVVHEYVDEEDDEVFVDTVPGDNTSTDMLIEGKEPVKMSVSSDEVELDEDDMQLEVAAGTPVLLNYLLTHPITCAIQ